MSQSNDLLNVSSQYTDLRNQDNSPKVLLQLNKSVFSKQKGYTENKYTETMTCSKLAANALGVNQIK